MNSIELKQLDGYSKKIRGLIRLELATLFEIGRTLSNAQELFIKGVGFPKWCEDEFDMNIYKARGLVRIYRKFGTMSNYAWLRTHQTKIDKTAILLMASHACDIKVMAKVRGVLESGGEVTSSYVKDLRGHKRLKSTRGISTVSKHRISNVIPTGDYSNSPINSESVEKIKVMDITDSINRLVTNFYGIKLIKSDFDDLTALKLSLRAFDKQVTSSISKLL